MTKPAKPLPDDISQLKRIINEQLLSLDKYEEEAIKRAEEYREETDRHRKALAEKEEELSRKKSYIERLEEMVRLLRHRGFAPRSEKIKGDDRQLGIFNEAEEIEEKSHLPAPDIEVKAHRRRGKPKRVKLPADLPREEVIIDLSEAEKHCPEGHALKCIGEEVSEQLDIIPAQIKVIRTIRKKYACPDCEAHVKRAPCPKTAIPKSKAGAGLLAYIAIGKYGDGLPLYRQEHILQRIGIEIPRATMASWMIKVGELLTPLINLMEEELLESSYIAADETGVQVLNEAGRPATSKSYMWVRGRNYSGAPPIILFEYHPSRGSEAAEPLFTDYKGYLQIDGYAGYNGVCAREGVIRCGCMSHCRRKFFEASKASKKGIGLANEALDMIRKLYEIEDIIEDKDVEERYRVRRQDSKPILEEFRQWIDDHLGKVPPKSQLGKALGYAHNEWEYLTRYIEDGRLRIDNNYIENIIRPFALGRKNWLFSAGVGGAKASAAIYSIIISAKENRHNEYAYFRYILEKLPYAESVEDFQALLPHKLKPQDVPEVFGNHGRSWGE